MAVDAAVAIAIGALWSVAGVVAWWKRREPLSWLASCIAVLVVASVAPGAPRHLAIALLPAAGFHLLLALPDGRLPRPAMRWIVVAYGIGAVSGLTLVGQGGSGQPVLVAALWIAALAAGLPLSNRRYRRASAQDQRRLQWFGCALAFTVELMVLLVAARLVADWPSRWPEVAAACTAAMPVALVVASFPRTIGRVDRVLTHTLATTGLTTLVVVVYSFFFLGFGHLPDDSERAVVVLSMVAAALVALVYGPVRRRLGDLINQLVYGERVSPDDSVRTFASRMTRSVPMDELLLQLTESLRKTFHVASAEIYTGAAGRYELAAGVPHLSRAELVLSEQERSVVARASISGGTWLDVWLKQLSPGVDRALLRVAPIAHGGELLGLIVLERRADSSPHTDDDDRVVTELARQVGLALHNVQLDSALQQSLADLRQANLQLMESRLRIVSAGDLERRKLERNLHDGAQQHLVAMAVKLRLVEELIEDEPAEATAVIAELRDNLKSAITELRALAHGIFPPLLASGGLAEALPAAANRSALLTSVETEGVGRYPAEVESSVYFCCLEAMQNAAKHAGADAELLVSVQEQAGVLRFTVADDGVGFDLGDEPAAGHGFVNMSDRLGALGGRLVVASAPGRGTSVSGEIPLQ